MGVDELRIIRFVLDKMPASVIVFDVNMGRVFCNEQAKVFLKRFEPPEELHNVCKRIFDAIMTSKLKAMFPGDIYMSKKIDGSSSNWTFRFQICEEIPPFVCVFITEEPLSNRMNFNKIRRQFGFTRRETDVVRRVLNGLKNIDIAEELVISEQTVKDHLSNIYMKAGCENRVELMSFLLNIPELPESLAQPFFV